jgi:hypothetical protein
MIPGIKVDNLNIDNQFTVPSAAATGTSELKYCGYCNYANVYEFHIHNEHHCMVPKLSDLGMLQFSS